VNRRAALRTLIASGFLMNARPVAADGSNGDLAAYYDRNLALINGVVYDWIGDSAPRRAREGVVQVGVGSDAYALLGNGDLVSWSAAPERAARLHQHVASFAAGRSGWYAIDRNRTLWKGAAGAEPRRVATGAIAACVGDGTDYYVTQDGALLVKGLAHRGQYGDGRLQESRDFVATARDAVAVRAHTGHALYLSRNGDVFGTGGNRYGPLSSHGLGDKADRWGRIFEGAAGIATGSRHSLAIRADRALWAWGQGFAVEPRKVLDGVAAAAAGDAVTLALTIDGGLWQWDQGRQPRQLVLR
jgi:Regulator of chromosome condensation (RCC1) repeat